jgi:rare lipoprotein A
LKLDHAVVGSRACCASDLEGDFVKPFLRMLLVAGVFVLSLAVVQEEARAEAMVSSWYGPGLEGNVTASGEIFDPYNDYTAAHPYLPMGTELKVCYQTCAVVRVSDRGPYVFGRDLDLSQAAAEEVGLTFVGTDVVEVRVLK